MPAAEEVDDRAARAAGRHAAWPRPRPAKALQYSRTRVERGGLLPCEAPDPGFGVHHEWVHLRPMGQFISPRRGVDREVDLVIHFHGHRPARKELARSGEDLVLLGVSLGIGKAYGPPFADPDVLTGMVRGVERALTKEQGHTVRVRRLALSSWSRGYEAIAEVLNQPLAERVDALILLDSLHASRDPQRGPLQLEPFRGFAERARRGEVLFVGTHSAIDPSKYASAQESLHYLIAAVGGAPQPAVRKDALGLELTELFSAGKFHVRGYAGNGKLDHCAHFGMYAPALRLLADRWRGATGSADPAR
jgi:hypothetical protein